MFDRSRSRDHFILSMSFPIGGPLERSRYSLHPAVFEILRSKRIEGHEFDISRSRDVIGHMTI